MNGKRSHRGQDLIDVNSDASKWRSSRLGRHPRCGGFLQRLLSAQAFVRIPRALSCPLGQPSPRQSFHRGDLPLCRWSSPFCRWTNRGTEVKLLLVRPLSWPRISGFGLHVCSSVPGHTCLPEGSPRPSRPLPPPRGSGSRFLGCGLPSLRHLFRWCWESRTDADPGELPCWFSLQDRYGS